MSYTLDNRTLFPDGAEVGAYGPHVPGFEVVRGSGRKPLGHPAATAVVGPEGATFGSLAPGLYQFSAEVNGAWRTVTSKVPG